jgi:AcrR family transcriptional regulator
MSKKQIKREAILLSAKEFISSNGGVVAKKRVEEITAHCGFSVGSFYNYYESYNHLIALIIMSCSSKEEIAKFLYGECQTPVL